MTPIAEESLAFHAQKRGKIEFAAAVRVRVLEHRHVVAGVLLHELAHVAVGDVFRNRLGRVGAAHRVEGDRHAAEAVVRAAHRRRGRVGALPGRAVRAAAGRRRIVGAVAVRFGRTGQRSVADAAEQRAVRVERAAVRAFLVLDLA